MNGIGQGFFDPEFSELESEIIGNSKTGGESFFDASYVIDALSNNDIDLNSAVCELIDNAIEAGAANICIETTKGPNKGSNKNTIDRIICVDDGCGMSPGILRSALTWGATTKKPSPSKKMGIGRFGVGLPAATTRLADHVEVYSSIGGEEPYSYILVDLPAIRKKEMEEIPAPAVATDLPDLPAWMEPYAPKDSGTIISLTRIKNATAHEVDELQHHIARTFRKFIGAGMNIYVNGKETKLFDPLFLDGPTRFDTPDKNDLRATPWTIAGSPEPVRLKGSDGRMHEVQIRLSLTPAEWRNVLPGDGQSRNAKDHHIPENEGVSILRSNREVCYGKVPYLIGSIGRRYEQIDRWWSCEISFPAELDDYFTVQFIKRGIEPKKELRDIIRKQIANTVDYMVNEVKEHANAYRDNTVGEDGPFNKAEENINDRLSLIPNTKRQSDTSEEEKTKQADKAYERVQGTEEEKDRRKKQAKAKKTGYQYERASLPSSMLFDVKYVDGVAIVLLNVDHPFYRNILAPLCSNDDDTSRNPNNDKLIEAIVALLTAHVHAEDRFFESDQKAMFEDLRLQWGSVLSALCRDM